MAVHQQMGVDGRDPRALRRYFMLPALVYPLWHLATPAHALDPWLIWWLVAAAPILVGLVSLRVAFVERHLPSFFHVCTWLVTAQLYVLAALNDMHPFYAIGSVMAVVATVLSIRARPDLVAYGCFVAAISACLIVLDPDPRKIAFWGGTLTLVAAWYYRLSLQVAAAALVRDHQETLEQKVEQRTAELSESNRRLRGEMEECARLEEELRISQRLEAVGRLAGGVAHEFNNLLTRIRLYAELLLQNIQDEEAVRREIGAIQAAGSQAGALTKQLLTFSRHVNVKTEILDLNRLVMNASSMLRHLVGEDVDLVILPAEGPACIRADRGQMEQVLVNLVLNGRDAMPNGGRLTIETSFVDGPALKEPDLGDSLTAERYVVLTVSDTGVGMDSETRARAFDPFFTRKQVDAGTGLGLSVVYGIVKQGSGYIRISSEEHKGSRFELYWPWTREQPTRGAGGTLTSATHRGSERILLVEDHTDLRRALSMLLGASGYEVIDAKDGETALRLASRNDDPIDLMITDVVMPRMSGLELVDEMSPIRPDTKVLLMSGHLSHPSLLHREVSEDLPLLSKPFDPEELTARIREVLDASNTAGAQAPKGL